MGWRKGKKKGDRSEKREKEWKKNEWGENEKGRGKATEHLHPGTSPMPSTPLCSGHWAQHGMAGPALW